MIESTGVNLLVLDEKNYQLSLRQMERERVQAEAFSKALEEVKSKGPLSKQERMELLESLGNSDNIEDTDLEELGDDFFWSIKATSAMREV